jgi:glycosyltransferase involved in cell wall biosynthesis
MSLQCRFTVITPTLNAERYLAECLESVQAQRVSGVEHVVVDGGSTDNTERIARHHPDVTFVSHPGWSQSQAINSGLRGASGNVVAWLNADDTYTEGAVAFVLERFDAEPSLDALLGDCEVVGPRGERLWRERPGAYDFDRLLRRGNYIAQPAVFLRHETLTAVGYLDESLHFGMDYDLWLRLRGRHVRYLQRSLARFRWHPESKSARGQMQNWREFLRIVRRYGGGWTPPIAWGYARCLVTIARISLTSVLSGSRPLRPLTRGRNILQNG